MKRLLIILVPLLILAGFFLLNSLPRSEVATPSPEVAVPGPEIGTFRLLDLGWPAYCDFYKDQAAQDVGQAVFASRSGMAGPLYVVNIDGELQEFDSMSDTQAGRTKNWAMSNETYSVSFEITDTSDVPEVQIYSGTLTVERGSARTTHPIIGRCSS